MPTENTWKNDAGNFLLGKTVAGVRYLTKEESEQAMFYSRPLAIIFSDGSYIVPMSDDEGNDGGALMTSSEKLPVIPVMQ